MLKGLNIRIYPNIKQTKVIERTFGCTRFVYNKVLGMKKRITNLLNLFKMHHLVRFVI